MTVMASSSCQFCIGGRILFIDGELKCINCGRRTDWKPQIYLPFEIQPPKNDYPRHGFGCAIYEDCLTCPLPGGCKWQSSLETSNRGSLKKWRSWIENNGNGHKK